MYIYSFIFDRRHRVLSCWCSVDSFSLVADQAGIFTNELLDVRPSRCAAGRILLFADSTWISCSDSQPTLDRVWEGPLHGFKDHDMCTARGSRQLSYCSRSRTEPPCLFKVLHLSINVNGVPPRVQMCSIMFMR